GLLSIWRSATPHDVVAFTVGTAVRDQGRARCRVQRLHRAPRGGLPPPRHRRHHPPGLPRTGRGARALLRDPRSYLSALRPCRWRTAGLGFDPEISPWRRSRLDVSRLRPVRPFRYLGGADPFTWPPPRGLRCIERDARPGGRVGVGLPRQVEPLGDASDRAP